MKKLQVALATAAAAVLLVSLVGCGGSSSTGPIDMSSSAAEAAGEIVSKYQVAEELQPLAQAVVAYTDADYGEDPADPATLAQAQANFGSILAAEEKWVAFARDIDYGASGISGLEPAIQRYNSALDDWQALQESGLVMWQGCIDASSDSAAVAMCMVQGYSVSDEQEALTKYTTAVKELLGVLGVSL